jgi:hypothetical protein
MDAAMGSSAAKASPHIALADILEFNEDGDSADIQEVGAPRPYAGRRWLWR